MNKNFHIIEKEKLILRRKLLVDGNIETLDSRKFFKYKEII